MNKPMQLLEPSSLFSPAPPDVANKGRREDGGSSFSSILSSSKDDPAGTESGQLLHAPGRKLPGQQESVDDHQYAAGGSPATRVPTDASERLDAFEEPLLVNAMDLPEQMAIQSSLQPALVVDEQEIGAAGVAEQTVNTDELIFSRAAGRQPQGQVVEVPGSLPVSNEREQVDVVRALGEVRGVPASILTVADSGRIAPEVEPVANAVREAVQAALANQASSRDLKQFLQQNWNHQAASSSVSVSDGAEAQTVPFLQTLADNVTVMPSARIQVPVGQPGWGQAVGSQIAWFVSQNISAASLRLNPQHLGPLEMQVSLDGDQASISFTSQQGLVRDALESSVPRLREMLSENGLNLVNVNVSQQGASHGKGQGTPGSRDGVGVALSESDTNELMPGLDDRQITTLTQGLVDFYA